MKQTEFTLRGIRAIVGTLGVAVSLTLPSAITAEPGTSPLMTGLAAQYTFSGNANDDSGNGHHGEVMGATLTADRFGNPNAAYHLDGVNDYIRIRDPITRELPYSWSIWVRPQFDHSLGQHWYFMEQGGEPNTGDQHSALEIDASRVFHFSEYHPWHGGIHTLYKIPSFTQSHWYHIVTTAERSGRYSIYVDGELASSSKFHACLVEDGCPYGVSSNMYFGANIGGSGGYFPGDIDDIHIYRRALSSDEVAALSAYTGDPNQPPLIWVQPVTQQVLSGAVLTLRVMAFGKQECSYQWQLSGVDLRDGGRTSGATSSTLQINAVTPGDAGAYTVVVSNAHGSVTTKPAILTVLLRSPEITTQPENQTLVSGASATFSVTAAGSLPMTYQWHRNGVELTDDGRIAGAKSETLSIAAVEVTDIGVYTVVVSNAYGRLTSRPASLAIARPADGLVLYYSFDTPEANTVQDLSGNNRSGVVHNAAWTAGGVGGGCYHFNGLDSSIRTPDADAFSIETTGELTVSAWIWLETITNYACIVGKGITFNYEWFLVQELEEEGTLHLRVTDPGGNGMADPRGGRKLTLATWHHVAATVRAGGSANIYINGERQDTVPYNGGSYNCSADLYIGHAPSTHPSKGFIDEVRVYRRALSLQEVQALAQLQPVFNAPLLVLQPHSSEVPSGHSVDIRVQAYGAMPLAYQWQFNGANLQDGGRVSGASTDTLRITDASVEDVGAYTVIVSNAYGSVTSTPAALTVLLRPPEITAQPENQTLVSGAPATLSVTAAGSLPMTYQWHRNGVELTDDGRIAGAKSETLSIAAVEVKDIGVYTLVVSNAYGSVTSRPASLAVLLQPPQIVSEPEDQTVVSGSLVTLTVAAAGSLPLSYQWQRNGADVVDDGRIVGAKTPNLSIESVRSDDLGFYTVVVRNAYGWIVSLPAELNVILAPPTITKQPDAVTMALGSTASLTVEVVGSMPLSYQWQRDGIDVTDGPRIAGAQTGTLTLTDLQFSDLGTYAAIVSNSLGRILSRTVIIDTSSAVLSLEVEAGQVVVEWNQAGRGMTLQRTALLSDVQWESASGSESTNRMIFPLVSGKDFFRLFRRAAVLAGPIMNPANGHLYYLLPASTWTEAEANAVQLGGHLVTVNDEAENQWLFDTFSNYGGVARILWIGLTDAKEEGLFEWADGSLLTFSRWGLDEPNDYGNEDYACILCPGDFRAPGWNDFPDLPGDFASIPMNGVVEVAP